MISIQRLVRIKCRARRVIGLHTVNSQKAVTTTLDWELFQPGICQIEPQ